MKIGYNLYVKLIRKSNALWLKCDEYTINLVDKNEFEKEINKVPPLPYIVTSFKALEEGKKSIVKLTSNKVYTKFVPPTGYYVAREYEENKYIVSPIEPYEFNELLMMLIEKKYNVQAFGTPFVSDGNTIDLPSVALHFLYLTNERNITIFAKSVTPTLHQLTILSPRLKTKVVVASMLSYEVAKTPPEAENEIIMSHGSRNTVAFTYVVKHYTSYYSEKLAGATIVNLVKEGNRTLVFGSSYP